MYKKKIKSLKGLKGRTLSAAQMNKLKGGNDNSQTDDDTIITQDVVEI